MGEGGSVEAGWYPDPEGTGKARYWSGSEWTDRTRSMQPSGDRSAPSTPPWPVLALGVAAALAAGALLVVLLGRDGGEAVEPTVPTLPPAEEAAAGFTTGEPSTTAAPAPTTAPPSGDPVNEWIAVLASVEAAPAGEADQRHAALTAQFPDARRLDSSQYESLRPGFRVSYVGPFPNGDAAVGFCTANGLAVPSGCYGRFLSHDPADIDLIADG